MKRKLPRPRNLVAKAASRMGFGSGAHQRTYKAQRAEANRNLRQGRYE